MTAVVACLRHLAALLLLPLLGAPILEPDLDLALGKLELVGDLLLLGYRYVFAGSERVL